MNRQVRGIDGTLFVGAPKGHTGRQHPNFFIPRHGRPEVLYNTTPVKYCDGVYIFECPYEQISQEDLNRFLFKRQLNHAANEIRINSGSAGGVAFSRLINILLHCSKSQPEKNDGYSLRVALNHENRDVEVGIEIGPIDQILRGGLDTQFPPGTNLLSSHARQIVEAALDGPDRSGYLEEVFDPQSHMSAMHLGYATLELLSKEIADQIFAGRIVRGADILATLGVDTGDAKGVAIEVDGDLWTDGLDFSEA